MRLEVLDQRVLLQHREAFGHRHRVRRDVEHLRAVDAGEADQVAALLRLLALLVEPDTDFRAARDLLADRVDVHVPSNALTRQHQLAGAGTIQVVALADRPLHQLRTGVHDGVGIVAAEAAATRTGRRPGVDRVRIVFQHEVRNRVMNDLARLETRRTNLDEPDPARLVEGQCGGRPVPDVLVLGGHRVLGRLDDEVRRTEAVAHRFPFVVGDERLGRREIFRIALHGAAVDPADDRVQLIVAQRHVVLEVLHADALVDVPRRHLPRRHALLDRAGPRPHVLERDERHRRDRVRLMALLAFRLEDRRDVLGKSDRLRVVSCGGQTGDHERRRDG